MCVSIISGRTNPLSPANAATADIGGDNHVFGAGLRLRPTASREPHAPRSNRSDARRPVCFDPGHIDIRYHVIMQELRDIRASSRVPPPSTSAVASKGWVSDEDRPSTVFAGLDERTDRLLGLAVALAGQPF